MRAKLKHSILLAATMLVLCGLFGCGSVAKNTVFTADDLSGKKIGVQLGTTGDTLVSDMEEDGSGTKVERYNKGNDAVTALKQGKVDAVVIDQMPAQSFVASNSDLKILEEEFAVEDYAICVSKSRP
jgi:polar amino acid transport system substrate-binding protein